MKLIKSILPNNTAVHCETLEQATELLQIAQEQGIKTVKDEDVIVLLDKWKNYGSQTGYNLNAYGNGGDYAGAAFGGIWNYRNRVVKAEEFLKELKS